MSKDGALAPQHEPPSQEWACGKGYELMNELGRQMSIATGCDGVTYKFVRAVIDTIEPQDPIEAMLLAQMTAIQLSTYTFLQKIVSPRTGLDHEFAQRALNKLARTFVMQMEALKRHRAGAEQKITVQQLSVQQGGQAIVANIAQAERAPAPDGPSVASPSSGPRQGQKRAIAPTAPFERVPLWVADDAPAMGDAGTSDYEAELETEGAEPNTRRTTQAVGQTARARRATKRTHARAPMRIPDDEPESGTACNTAPDMPTVVGPSSSKRKPARTADYGLDSEVTAAISKEKLGRMPEPLIDGKSNPEFHAWLKQRRLHPGPRMKIPD
jgi:hypothetical protein